MLPQKDLFKTITLFQVEPVSVRGAWVVCDSIGLLADKLAFPNSLKKKKKLSLESPCTQCREHELNPWSEG